MTALNPSACCRSLLSGGRTRQRSLLKTPEPSQAPKWVVGMSYTAPTWCGNACIEVMQRLLGTLHASSWAISDCSRTTEGRLLGDVQQLHAARCLACRFVGALMSFASCAE